MKQAIYVSAPGRINIIGEHTDYNGGLVFPAAIQQSVLCKLTPKDGLGLTFKALDLDDQFTIDLNDDFKPNAKSWVNYLLGVLHQLKKQNCQLGGFELKFHSSIPMGAGLSSSAALCCGFVAAINQCFDLRLSHWEMVKIAQKSEHEFAGVQCGIMDQFASIFGQKDQALLLNCLTEEYSSHKIDLEKYQLVLCDSMVKHELASTEYNTRREECIAGLAAFKERNPSIETISDIDWDDLIMEVAFMDDLHFRRLSFVVQENERVRASAKALATNNIQQLGKLMYQSHEGLEQLYQVSCEELDFLVDQTYQMPQVAGARMMGGGFGGCTINLVKRSFLPEFRDRIQYAFHQRFSLDTRFIEVEIGQGVSIISEDQLPDDSPLLSQLRQDI